MNSNDFFLSNLDELDRFVKLQYLTTDLFILACAQTVILNSQDISMDNLKGKTLPLQYIEQRVDECVNAYLEARNNQFENVSSNPLADYMFVLIRKLAVQIATVPALVETTREFFNTIAGKDLELDDKDAINMCLNLGEFVVFSEPDLFKGKVVEYILNILAKTELFNSSIIIQ